jgi:hypothetical protein
MSEKKEYKGRDLEPPVYDSTNDTLDHINRVRDLLFQVVARLSKRAIEHDASKLASPEKEVFDRVTPLLRSLTYGSPEYEKARQRLGDALAHHYAHNSHHPEHYVDLRPVLGKEGETVPGPKHGINGMDLLDVLEMLCDWKAATLRHADGDLRKSLEVNRTRFEIGDQLLSILENTARNLRLFEDK